MTLPSHSRSRRYIFLSESPLWPSLTVSQHSRGNTSKRKIQSICSVHQVGPCWSWLISPLPSSLSGDNVRIDITDFPGYNNMLIFCLGGGSGYMGSTVCTASATCSTQNPCKYLGSSLSHSKQNTDLSKRLCPMYSRHCWRCKHHEHHQHIEDYYGDYHGHRDHQDIHGSYHISPDYHSPHCYQQWQSLQRLSALCKPLLLLRGYQLGSPVPVKLSGGQG